MTTYRLFPSTNGPSTGASYSGGFLAGCHFYVTEPIWFQGIWYWVNSGTNPNPTTPQVCALWHVGANTQAAGCTLIASVTSGTLVAGWNYIPFATPIQLTANQDYLACTAVNGNFPSTPNSFGASDPDNNLSNGPLHAVTAGTPGWIPGGGVLNECYATVSDPTATIPLQADSTGDNWTNFWVDVQVTDQMPTGQHIRIWPNCPNIVLFTNNDAASPYNVATEFSLSQSCSLQKIWFYSTTGCTGLPSECAIWTVPGGTTAGSLVSGTDATSVSWLNSSGGSGAAAGGWLYHDYSSAGIILAPGTYKASVYDGNATPTSSTSYEVNYWGPTSANPGYGGFSIAGGILTVPDTAHGNIAYDYNSGNGGATPPYSTTSTEPAQCTFSENATNGAPISYPFLYVGTNSPGGAKYQTYYVDVELLPVSGKLARAFIKSQAVMAGSYYHHDSGLYLPERLRSRKAKHVI